MAEPCRAAHRQSCLAGPWLHRPATGTSAQRGYERSMREAKLDQRHSAAILTDLAELRNVLCG